MTGVNLKQVRDYIVAPTLKHIGLYSLAAERLVLGTALTESGLKYIDQVDKADKPGPAYGFFQMERATHEDLWDRYLVHHPELAAKVRGLMIIHMDRSLQLHGNAFYAAAMCRVHYRRIQAPMPPADDIEAMAMYWKTFYNTRFGKGRPADFMEKAAPVWAL